MSKQDNVICKKLRKKIFITGFAGGMAHLASCYSAVEIIYSLYMKDIMKYDPNQPTLPDRDRFILSKGHAAWHCLLLWWKQVCLQKMNLTAI